MAASIISPNRKEVMPEKTSYIYEATFVFREDVFDPVTRVRRGACAKDPMVPSLQTVILKFIRRYKVQKILCTGPKRGNETLHIHRVFDVVRAEASGNS